MRSDKTDKLTGNSAVELLLSMRALMEEPDNYRVFVHRRRRDRKIVLVGLGQVHGQGVYGDPVHCWRRQRGGCGIELVEVPRFQQLAEGLCCEIFPELWKNLTAVTRQSFRPVFTTSFYKDHPILQKLLPSQKP